MYHTIMPPYKVKDGKEIMLHGLTSDPADREYIDIMGANESCSNPGIGDENVTGTELSASLVRRVPNLQEAHNIRLKERNMDLCLCCRSGYYVWKNPILG